MDIYKIKIRSVGSDWTDNKTLDGTITEADGAVIINYSLDGDECVLTVKNGVVTQERRGKQCVKITFEESRKTECVIGNGGLSGAFEIFTRSLKFFSGKGGYKLSLEYLNGSDEELINLTLTAVKKGY